jgi:beta-lactamase regulating signal transducer with metallopeptidase domain/predicted HAD superfamily phosphohydrolase YqeG
MTGMGSWASPQTMRLVGMALLHFLWQGAAIAAVAFLAMSLVRRASAKYLVGVAMLVAMVAAPAVTFLVLEQRHEAAAAVAGFGGMAGAGRGLVYGGTSHVVNAASAADAADTKLLFGAGTSAAETESSIYLLWFVEAWFLGVVLLSLRPAAGFFLVERLRLKKGKDVAGALRARCLELQARLGLNRVVRYCESLQLETPAVAGWFRPMMLLPVSALTGLTEQQLDAVIAHELAHVKRLDSFVNLFQIAAETLLFYHPAVWWLSKCVRAERENCCDDVAIAVCGNAVEYARALATMAEWQCAPALAMATNRSPLAERVARLLGVTKLSGGLRSAGIAGSVLCLCASVLAGNALLGAARSSQQGRDADAAPPAARPAPVAQPALAPVPARDRDAVIVIRPSKALPAPAPAPSPAIAPVIAGVAAIAPAPEVAGVGENEDAQAPESKDNGSDAKKNEGAKAGSYIDALKAEGITDISIDQLIALKIQGVTAEYVRQIHAAGLKPDVDALIAMRVQGVTPEIIREMKISGLAQDIDQIIAMQVQGVTTEYVKQLHDLGIKVDANDVLAMKVQGISPDYVRAMREAVDPKLGSDELIAMKVQDVTPEYVRSMKATGLQLDADDIIAMKVQDVTPEYVKEMQAAGLKLDKHAVIGAKVQGVTPEFIERAKKHGFQNLTIDKLIALKNSGVLDE